MRRFLSMALSIVMTITIMLALPVSAQAESTEGIAPADIKIINDDYNDLFDSFEKGAGYINLIENEETGENVEIVNLFHSEAVTPHKGVTYDLATNTLTLDNVNGGSWKILCDQMLHLKINVKGTCSIGSFSFWDTYPDFIGTGTLTVNEGIGGAVNNNISAKGIKPVSVSNTVTLTLKAGKGNPAANLNVLSDKNIYDTANLISYAGKVSDPLNWEKKEEFGGPSNDWISLRGVRVRTVFKATEILKKNDYTGNDNYYIKSISHVGNEPMTYHHISQLVLKDGVWVEKDDGNNYWSKDELFTNYTAAEVASLPSSLVNSEGNATAYLSTQFDYGQAYIKDNKVFILNGGGIFRNLIVDPEEPAPSVYGNDMGADVVMKVVKQIPDENMNLVVFEEEYEMEDTANYDKAAEFLKTKGYEKFMKMLDHPYNLRYELLNTSVTFFPAPVTDNADNGTGDAGNSGKTADTVKLKGTKLGKVKSPKKAQIKVTWKKQTKQTTGYQIQYGTKSNFKGAKTVTISKNKTTSATIKKLKSKKKYFVRIRTFKKDGKKKSYSDWSKAKSVKVK